MKVLQINATLGYTSTGTIVKDIGELIDTEGGESFYAFQTSYNPPHNSFRIGNVFDWKLHALYCRIFGKQAYFSKKATKKLLKHIAEIKPDIVHLHNLHSNYIHLNMLLEYLKNQNIAVVITMHDCWYFTGKCFHYADIDCEKFITGCGNCPKKKLSQRSLIWDCSNQVLNDKYSALSQISRITLVGCSKWICNEAKKSVLNRINIEHIYNGIDIDIFKPYDGSFLRKQYELDEDCYIVMGMANKWLQEQNRKVLVKVLPILNKKMKLLIVGCTKKQIKSLKQLSDNIIPIGFIKDRELLAKYYSFSDVFVNVTNADTLPTVNMESICCGTPVITYDCCGSSELVLDGCGRIISEKDTDLMVSAISQRIDPIDSIILSNARNQFDKNRCYKKYLEIYKTVTNKEKI